MQQQRAIQASTPVELDILTIDANTVQTPNLTKQDAALRAGLLRVESYDVILDLTDADGGRQRAHLPLPHAPSPSTANRPGASTFVDVIADRLHEVSLNGQPVDICSYQPAGRHRAGGIGRAQPADHRRRPAIHLDRAGTAPLRRPDR